MKSISIFFIFEACKDNKCQPMETNCMKERKEVGANPGMNQRKPECDDDGNYMPRQCTSAKGLCRCVDKETGCQEDTIDAECKDGEFMQMYDNSKDYCNCCPPKCIKYIKEGDECADAISEYTPSEMCGPRLGKS